MTTESARTRETIWQYTKRAIADHPLAGIGFGEQQFLKVINHDYGFVDRYGETSLDNPHNFAIPQMTVWRGSARFLFVSLTRSAFGAARSILGKLAERQTHMAFGLAVGLTGFLAVIYPDMHMFTQTVAPVYWVFFGLLLSLTTASEQPAAVVKPYEDSRAHFGNAGQRLAGQAPSWTPQYPRHRPRVAAGPLATRSNGGRP